MHPFERMQDAIVPADFPIAKEYGGRFIPPQRCLGSLRPHVPALDLSNYIVGEPVAPPAVHRRTTRGLGMLLNDRLGDCGEAMSIHAVEMFHRDAGTPVPRFTDADAERWYEVVGGYDPSQTKPDGSNPTDQGTDNNVLVAKWRDVGIECAADQSRHNIVGSVFVDPANANLTRLAIWEFIVCFRAYGLPLAAQQQLSWDLSGDRSGDAAVGSWGYHDVPLTSYGPHRVGLITWGQPWTATWGFDQAYAVQSFVVVTREQANLQGVSPAGVDWTKLNADLGNLPPTQS